MVKRRRRGDNLRKRDMLQAAPEVLVPTAFRGARRGADAERDGGRATPGVPSAPKETGGFGLPPSHCATDNGGEERGAVF